MLCFQADLRWRALSGIQRRLSATISDVLVWLRFMHGVQKMGFNWEGGGIAALAEWMGESSPTTP